MDKSSLKAKSLQTLKNFTVAVNEEFVSQCSPGFIKWSSIKRLVKLLKQCRMESITSEFHQEVFIENLVKYVELVMGFLSDDKNMEYRKQIQYAAFAMDFIPEMLVTPDLKNNFVKHATESLMGLFMYGRYNLVSKKSLITMYNIVAAETKKSVRISLAESSCGDIMYKLLDCLSIQGDFALQADILETVFRIFGNEVKFKPETRHLLVPNSMELSEALANDFSIHNFDIDVRNWLEKFNKDSQNVFSIGCKTVMYGSYECQIPEEFDVMWVDFNLIENMLCLVYKEPDSWNRITVPFSYVKKTKVKRPLGASESTISFYLSKPCVSAQNQKFWDELDKHLKMIISNTEKDKINRLITQVLPQAFGDSFEHGSEKILKHPRPVYKPLGIKISKKKSGVMSASSVSRSRSEAASTVEAMSPRGFPEEKVSAPMSPQSACRSDEGSVGQPKLSYAHMNREVGSDISSAVITDFTRRSRYGAAPGASLDGVVSIRSNNSDVFLSNAGSVAGPEDSDNDSCRFDTAKVQDNIVTSSYEENMGKFCSEIQILSGGSSRVSAHQTIIQEASEFQKSEILSSSPLKISKQKDDPDISSEMYSSANSGDEEEQEENHHQNIKVSAVVQSQEDLFTEDLFETAHEEFADVKKISHCRESQPLQKELPKLQDHKAGKKHSKVKEKEIGIGDTKWTSRLRSRTTKASAEEKRLDAVEDVVSEPSDEEEAAEVITKPKEPEEMLTKAFSEDPAQEVITKPKESVEEILTEAFSEEPAQEVITNKNQFGTKGTDKETDKEKNEERKETEVAPVALDADLLTEDLEIIEIDSQQDHQPIIQDSEFSLLVNVGTASQYSEDDRQAAKVLKDKLAVTSEVIGGNEDEERGVPRLGKNSLKKNEDDKLDMRQIEENEAVTKDGTDLGKNNHKEPTVLEVTKKHTDDALENHEIQKKEDTQILPLEKDMELVIDLTLDDLEKQSSKQDDVRVVAEEVAPMFNTPELLGILQPSVREIQSTEKKDTTKDTEEAVRIVGTNEEVVKKKRKRGRTLIQTGKKRFDLKALLQSQADKDILDVGEKKIQKNDGMEKDSFGKGTVAEVFHNFEEGNREITDDVACVAVEEGVKNVIDSGTNIFGNEKEIVNDIPEENVLERGQKEEQDIEKKDTAIEKEASVAKPKAAKKKKRGKTFIKKGKKRLNLKKLPSSESDDESLAITKQKLQKKYIVAETSLNFEENNQEITYGVACEAVEEGVKNVIDSGNHIFGNEKEIVNNFPEESVPVVSQKQSHTQVSQNSQPEILAPEINASKIDYLERFDELQKEENVKSNVSESHTQMSQSKIFAPEINASNIDYLERFDELKREEDAKSNVSESHTQMSQSEIFAPEINASNIDYLERFDELKREEDAKSNVSASSATPKTVKSIEEPKNFRTEEESDDLAVLPEDKENFKYSSVRKKQKSSGDGRKRMVDKSAEFEKRKLSELLDNHQDTVQNNNPEKMNNDVSDKVETLQTPKILAAKTPDTSPDQPPQVVVEVAQIHQAHETSPKTDPKQRPVKKSERLLKKKSTEDNLSQELRQMEESLKKRDRDHDEIVSVAVDSAPKIGRTRSGTRKNTSRKLFDPANLEYLDQMPALAEQLTPEFIASPITPPITTKLPKNNRRAPKKKAQKADLENSKPKTDSSSKNQTKKAKGLSEKPKKTVKKNRGNRNFDFSTVDFKSLDELFNRSCARIANRTSYGGVNATSFQPLVVRSTAIDTSSDESPNVFSSMPNKNVPNTKYTPDKVGSSSDFSWPELEIENKGNKTNKIRILQDIVIKPKRPQPQEKIKSPRSAKRRKLEFDEIPPPVPLYVPLDLDNDQAFNAAEMAAVPQLLPPPVVPDFVTVVPIENRSTRDGAFQSDQFSAAVPENMKCQAQENAANKEFHNAIALLDQMMNPKVLNMFKKIIEHKDEVWELLQRHH